MPEFVPRLGRGGVAVGPWIDDKGASPYRELHRKGVRMRMTAVHGTERAAVHDRMECLRVPAVPQNGVAADREQLRRMSWPLVARDHLSHASFTVTSQEPEHLLAHRAGNRRESRSVQ